MSHSYFPSWAMYLPYSGRLPVVLDFKTSSFYDVDRVLRHCKPEEAVTEYRMEYKRAVDTLDAAQGCLISLIKECESLRAQNEFMLGLINRHMIAENGE